MGTTLSKGSSGLNWFSDPHPVVPDNTADSDTFFSSLWNNIKDAATGGVQQLAEYVPVWTQQLFEDQTHDQTRDPTFDRRQAPPTAGTPQNSAPPIVSTSLIPGVPNGVLLIGGAAIIALLLVRR